MHSTPHAFWFERITKSKRRQALYFYRGKLPPGLFSRAL